jgi:hypothetical protein
MKKLTLFLSLLTFLFLINTIGTAQSEIKIISGNLDFLRGDSTLNILYNYDKFYVGQLTEREYIDKWMENLKDKKQEKRDEWVAEWMNERPRYYQPRFDSSLNKIINKVNFSAHELNIHSKYTMMVTTNYIEPGFYAYHNRQPSEVRVQYVFFATDNPYVILANISSTAHGGVLDSRGRRIANAYDNLGILLGNLLAKASK